MLVGAGVREQSYVGLFTLEDGVERYQFRGIPGLEEMKQLACQKSAKIAILK